MLNSFKNLLFQNQITDGLDTWNVALGTRPGSHDDHELTLFVLTARSSMGMFHGKFLENFGYEIGLYSCLYEYMVIYECKRSGLFFDL